MTGTGLKKCMPTTWLGRLVAAAILVTEIDEVLVARRESFLTISSISANSFTFRSTCSSAASTTRSQSAMGSRSTVVLMRPSAVSFASSESLLRETSRSRLFLIVDTPRSTNFCSMSRMTTS